ncbi:MAG: squalene/phytoene synthase family protein, partial [Acidobacteriota bacterium]
TVDRYETFEDLYRYCFCVASSVGLACLHIFGFSDERARKYAEYCGIAFQLTNILRDIREDTLMGRTYLPIEDLQRFHYSGEDLRNAVLDDRFRRLMAFETNRARKYYAWGRNLLPLVDGAGRPALWAMMEIYNHLLRKIARRRYDVFGPAIRLSRRAKISIALRAMAMRLLPG